MLKRYKRILSILIITVIWAGFLPEPLLGAAAQYSCPPNYIRVALALNMASADFSIIEGSYELVDYITQKVISTNPASGSWIVAPAGNNSLQLSHNGNKLPGMASTLVVLRQKDPQTKNVFRFKTRRCRGDMLIENLNGQIQIINVIDVEQYLYGVVGAEIGTAALEEALKAQAVVSRTYALYYKEHPQLNYDVGITTQWQVYGGYDSEITGGVRIIKAVDDTKGQVIYYDNSIIRAFFHSNSGGYTESSENVWYESLAYICSVSAPEDIYALQVSQNDGWPANTYQWQKDFTKKELAEQIRGWNTEHPSETIKVGEITDIRVGRLATDPITHDFINVETSSKRVTQLDIVGSTGIKSFFRDKIRSVFGLRSTLFDIVMDSTVGIWTAFQNMELFNNTKEVVAVNADGMISKLNGSNGNYYVVGADGVKAVPKQYSVISFRGKGHGHGLGMSQWGAQGMAAQGNSYKKIIDHYYNQNKNDGRLIIKGYQTTAQQG